MKRFQNENSSGRAALVWIFLFALIPGGFDIAISGRTPEVLFVDLCLITVLCVLVLQTFLGSFTFDLSDTRLCFWISTYIFANLLSTLFNLRDVGRSLIGIKVFLFGYLTYLVIISTVNSGRALTSALYALSVWSGAVGILLIYKFMTQWQADLGRSDVKGEIGISMGQSNYLAAMLVPLFPIGISLLVAEKGILKKIIISGSCLAAFLGLLITMSRGALVSLFTGAAFCLPLLLRSGLKLRHVAVSILVVVLLLLVTPAELLSSQYTLFMDRAENLDYGRLDLWKVAWSVFVHNPLLGVGPNSIYLYNERVMPYTVRHTHNFILNNLAEVGLIGSIPFFMILASILRRAYRLCSDTMTDARLKTLALGAFVGLVATLAHGMVEPTFPGTEYSTVFWTLVGIVFLLDRRSRHERISTLSTRGPQLPNNAGETSGPLPAVS